MTNAGLKELFNEFKERLCIIMLDNNLTVLFGYDTQSRYNWEQALMSIPEEKRNEIKGKLVVNDTLYPNSIEFKSYDGVDFFGVPVVQLIGSTYVRSKVWHKTECIQAFATVDEDFSQWRVDPHRILS